MYSSTRTRLCTSECCDSLSSSLLANLRYRELGQFNLLIGLPAVPFFVTAFVVTPVVSKKMLRPPRLEFRTRASCHNRVRLLASSLPVYSRRTPSGLMAIVHHADYSSLARVVPVSACCSTANQLPQDNPISSASMPLQIRVTHSMHQDIRFIGT